MATSYRGLIKRWIYVALASSMLAALFLWIFVLESSTRPELTFASENEGSDANQAPVDANAQSEQKQKPSKKKQVPRPEHTHPAFTERTKERARMVAGQIQGRDVSDPNVLRSMLTVPRHAFVRHRDLRRAYADHPLPIGLGQTISQPYIVAYMTEALNLDPNYKVLEIGTGSGYQAAVCAEIVREVYTIEIIEELAKSAKQRLKELGYRNVSVKAGDGYFGWKEKGPFDAIIITAAAGLVPPPLVEQLKPDGRMILPFGSPYGAQTLILITKDNKGKMSSKRLIPVRFVPMLGRVTKAK
ncbi:MAG: protein-L-isoaspartate(D-aspartate) O-methyltransferase [Planctomycetota bacterium]|jgi:protein-L-isoaspartate(D-aspartate) O-methyltransferase